MSIRGRTSLEAPEPGLCVPSAESPGLIPCQGTGFCMPQLKILYMATKTWAQPNKGIYIKKNERQAHGSQPYFRCFCFERIVFQSSNSPLNIGNGQAH